MFGTIVAKMQANAHRDAVLKHELDVLLGNKIDEAKIVADNAAAKTNDFIRWYAKSLKLQETYRVPQVALRGDNE